MTDPKRMHLDHSTARALAGPNTVGDRMVCKPCNEWLGAKLGAMIRNATRVQRRRSRRW